MARVFSCTISCARNSCSVLLANGRVSTSRPNATFQRRSYVGALFGFLIRDAIVGLQHQRRRQQARRHTRPTMSRHTAPQSPRLETARPAGWPGSHRTSADQQTLRTAYPLRTVPAAPTACPAHSSFRFDQRSTTLTLPCPLAHRKTPAHFPAAFLARTRLFQTAFRRLSAMAHQVDGMHHPPREPVSCSGTHLFPEALRGVGMQHQVAHQDRDVIVGRC